MKCTNNTKKILCLLLTGLLLAGCGEREIEFDHVYDISDTYTKIGETLDDSSDYPYFATEKCVAPDEFTANEAVSDTVSEAIGLFDLTDSKVIYQKNIYEKLYPASVTKIMTCYLALKYGKLTDIVKVSEKAVDQASDSSVCGLEAGNELTLNDLLYGLMLRSGNDAAVAVAEHISGSVEEFAELMNQEAAMLGATGTHFVNPNGLHSFEHFTTLYDIYLIFTEAMKTPGFSDIVGTAYYEPKVKRSDGSDYDLRWTNTNKYINGDNMPPEGVTITGGKTGTTSAAGYCLVVSGVNAAGHDVVGIVLKADSRYNLYFVMNQILTLN